MFIIFFCHFLIPQWAKKKRNIFQLQPFISTNMRTFPGLEPLEVLSARGDSLRALSSRCKTKKQQCSTSQVQHT